MRMRIVNAENTRRTGGLSSLRVAAIPASIRRYIKPLNESTLPTPTLHRPQPNFQRRRTFNYISALSTSLSCTMVFARPAFAFAAAVAVVPSRSRTTQQCSIVGRLTATVSSRCGLRRATTAPTLSSMCAVEPSTGQWFQGHDDGTSDPYSLILGNEQQSELYNDRFESASDVDATTSLDHGGGPGSGIDGSSSGNGGFNNNGDDDRSGNSGNGGEGTGGGSGGEGGGGDHMDRSSILSKYGKSELDLPADVQSLTGSALDGYLSATRGLSGLLASVWSGWRRRCAADPEFPFKLLMEQTVGLGLTVSGMVAARGKDILNELDFAICDTVVGATMNFVLVYLLTPALAKNIMAKNVSTQAATGLFAQLPANVFARGNYSLPMRIAGFLHKSALFSVCGFVASVIGTSVSYGLVMLRQRSSVIAKTKTNGHQGQDQEHQEQQPSPKLPNVFTNSLAWAGFMFVSSSPRYQVVAGVERAVFQFAPDSLAKFSSGLVRTGNNVLGGATWVLWAKAIGLQKSDKSDDSAQQQQEGHQQVESVHVISTDLTQGIEQSGRDVSPAATATE